MMTAEPEENDDGQVEGMFGSISEQNNEAYFDDRSDAEDDLLKGQIKFPKEKIYGRDDELAKLRSIYNDVSQQAGENTTSAAVFIAGYSGTGKSALVEAFAKQLDDAEEDSHLFASGKYSELRAETPFSAIAEALSKVTSELMTGDPDELQRVRDNLKAAGVIGDGDEGEVLISMFPVLSQLLRSEEQQQVEPASAASYDFETFKYVFQQFVRALCTKIRPFTLYIDDLQWVDVASLEIITTLLLNKSIQFFMFIGAYRSNEVDEEHAFYQRIL
mmetsp:Transcript_2832/g.4568  ORF Transcript_2832/g.4568 Transcript_2832/m.4568 type:complete len:274 (-) Transcript_2832:100-921(-)